MSLDRWGRKPVRRRMRCEGRSRGSPATRWSSLRGSRGWQEGPLLATSRRARWRRRWGCRPTLRRSGCSLPGTRSRRTAGWGRSCRPRRPPRWSLLPFAWSGVRQGCRWVWWEKGKCFVQFSNQFMMYLICYVFCRAQQRWGIPAFFTTLLLLSPPHIYLLIQTWDEESNGGVVQNADTTFVLSTAVFWLWLKVECPYQ